MASKKYTYRFLGGSLTLKPAVTFEDRKTKESVSLPDRLELNIDGETLLVNKQAIVELSKLETDAPRDFLEAWGALPDDA